ncbi:SixA phosphatase family protein [Shimia aestuarii]|uniref:Histidine phosphatase superfamily (Branch 1) n=1 Tax=Shimia aestuarii TaxID=254406 RepID=A0A1I4RJ24_9RHOB|nr:phosphoglycerate mutase family protein [Shimia aestuarii]SFM52254.1 Histidine phosphatase superfamily (branch 1) [Shimia aestuarii]
MNKPVKTLLLLLTLWLAAPLHAQELVLAIRHAEKQDGPDPALTEDGRARAANWATMLRPVGLDVVITSEARRTVETGTLIANALDLPLISFPANTPSALLDALEFDHEGDRVLIVGHVETLPGILTALGAPDPVEMTQAQFDRLFILNAPNSGAATLNELRMP